MSRLTALLDANVLHSYPLTSLLLELAEARLYRPVWSDDIHTEWRRSVLRARPSVDPGLLERRRVAMDEALPDACVRGYAPLITELTLPDPEDRHVLAAAIHAKAQVIVTFNEGDFQSSTLNFSYATLAFDFTGRAGAVARPVGTLLDLRSSSKPLSSNVE